jgi:small-conductance mechanosensitive channel
MAMYLAQWERWLWSAALLVGAVLFALVLHRMAFRLARRITARSKNVLDKSLVRHGEKPVLLMAPLLMLLAVLPLLRLPVDVHSVIRHAIGLGLIGSLGWLLIAMLGTVDDVISARRSIEVHDNLAARRLRTQVEVLHRILVMGILVVTLAIMLMTFPSIRHLGESLFASAGLAALVAGFAARTTLSNLVAGLQIALTQPIRLDDVVIVEGEWGRIEEISTTYVVVRIWDLRRLVVPLSYFIEKPFQNWTRKTSNLLGTVFVYTDYTVPVDVVRSELHRILERSAIWDGKVWGLQVSNAGERTMELRALMSAPDSSSAWDLRCHVREHLIRFLQEHYPQSLPRTRAEILAAGKESALPIPRVA